MAPRPRELPIAPAAIADPKLTTLSSPQEWFQVLTLGRLARYMPPFANTLTPQQRWDVLAYVYGLGMNSDLLDSGSQVYARNQAEVDHLLQGDDLAAKQSLFAPLGLKF